MPTESTGETGLTSSFEHASVMGLDALTPTVQTRLIARSSAGSTNRQHFGAMVILNRPSCVLAGASKRGISGRPVS
ncbi:hypothetical protein [Pendulispora albinea]|uniref:Uncharacterized protein n=1 Tax=Pendulispora albinea TaxID=2741071 RepID=A0ABZ2MAJ7_9BACT